MKLRKYCTKALGVLLCLNAFGTAADHSQWRERASLAGRVAAVEAEIVFSLDPESPEGLVFENCYIFNEDGSWEDPLFPAPGTPVPGTWVQHTDFARIFYTATVADLAPDVLLIQNGRVYPARGRAKQRIIAYTTVFLGGDELFIEVVSRGRMVDECPYF